MAPPIRARTCRASRIGSAAGWSTSPASSRGAIRSPTSTEPTRTSRPTRWAAAYSSSTERGRRAMPVTTTPHVLQVDEIVAHLRALRTRQPVRYWAFYSSQLGGIVTDPALMVLPFDDHIVHRGHGVFDTAAVVHGKIYDLEAHLDRFIRSAELAKLRLPPGGRKEMEDVIIRTAAA